jgi:hypothetical protein
LRIGSSYKNVVILGIDSDEETARISHDGNEMVLDFEHNGIKEGTYAAAHPTPPASRVPLPGPATPVRPPVLTAEQARRIIEERRALYQSQNDARGHLLPLNNPGARVQPTAMPVR